ncbi:MAG: sensor histidine kinase [Nannocystaceae bacterium]
MPSRHARQRSISLPVTLSSVAVALAVAMVGGWTLLIVRNRDLTDSIVSNTWLLVAGIASLVVIITVLVLFLIFLIREIREVRRQTGFIDSVTHELKSPLAALKLCLETLAREGLPEDRREQLRHMMIDDVERLTVFIDRVLAATRVGQEQVHRQVNEIVLVALCQRCAELVRRRNKLEPGAIKIEVDPSRVVVSDEVALAAVLENLLDNAVKYSNPPVDVDLRASEVKGRLVIEVQDAGIGIPRAQLKRIFDRFYRVPQEEVRARRGTGLGLYVVSALVRTLGGKVEAESEGLGAGTTMRVSLPKMRRS